MRTGSLPHCTAPLIIPSCVQGPCPTALPLSLSPHAYRVPAPLHCPSHYPLMRTGSLPHCTAPLIIPSCVQGPCPTVLHEAALCLLVSLWEGRHDAALIALRSTKDFWSHLTAPLSTPPLSWRGGGGVRVVAAVMRIVTMETYSTDTK